MTGALAGFVPVSTRNHAGTDETVPLLLAARARTHQMPREIKAHSPAGTRTQDPSQTVRAPGPLSYRATRSTHDTWVTDHNQKIRTTRDKLSLRKKWQMFRCCPLWFTSATATACLLGRANIRAPEYSVSRTAERRARPISVTDDYLQVHVIIFFVSKKWFSRYFSGISDFLAGAIKGNNLKRFL